MELPDGRIDVFKLWCWRRLKSPLDSKEIKPVNPKGNQPWIVTRRTDDEAEAPILLLGEAHWLKPPTLASHHYMSCFTTGGPDKDHRTNKPPPTGRVEERSKWDTTCPTTSQNSSFWHSSWLNTALTPLGRTLESEWSAKDNPETNPIPIKPETASHVTEQFSWVPLPGCSLPGCPFPIKSLALSAHVSPRTIHFWVLDKSPVSGPGRGPPSCNTLATWCELTHWKRLIRLMLGKIEGRKRRGQKRMRQLDVITD